MVLLGLTARDWISEEFPSRPKPPSGAARVQHPLHHESAVKALNHYYGLPECEKTAFLKSLAGGLSSPRSWLTRLEQSKTEVICLGEYHEESTRAFLAEQFFTRLTADVLLLETTPAELKRLLRKMDIGRDYFPLLNADILQILRSATGRNAQIKIRGIEQTSEQERREYAESNTRDRYIALNFWKKFQPGKRHIILFGAMHCTDETNWLFHNLCGQASARLRKRMINVQVLGEHQNGPLEAFVYFLDEIGIEKTHFVVPDTRALPARIYRWFPLLNRQTLKKYGTLIVFR